VRFNFRSAIFAMTSRWMMGIDPMKLTIAMIRQGRIWIQSLAVAIIMVAGGASCATQNYQPASHAGKVAPGQLAAEADSLSASNSHHANFRYFNGIRYHYTDYLNNLGLTRFTSIYDVWKLSCDARQCYNVPTEDQFKSILSGYASQFGSSDFIAFDFENIVIDKAASEAQARHQAALIKQFIAWTRGVYPNAKLGMYDYDFNYRSKYENIRASLYQAGGFDFFAPTLYQRWPSHEVWLKNLMAAAENDRRLNPNLPIYAYISPYKGGDVGSAYLGDKEWFGELTDAKRHIDGVIVWQGDPVKGEGSSPGWLQVLKKAVFEQ
jgi:hypothetical protein